MNKSIFEKVKEVACIEEVVEHFGVRLDSHWKALCPFHQEKTPSFSVKREDNIFKCFGCGESGDAIDFVAKVKGVEGVEAARLIAEMYGIGDSPNGVKQKVTQVTSKTSKAQGKANVEQKTKKASKQAIKAYLEQCIKDIDKTDYFQKRGLSKDTIDKFCLGYDIKKNCVVIPYSSKLEYYQTRSIDGKKFRKPKLEEAGPEPLYAEENLRTKKNELVFVVESPICAISIMQETKERAVAICGSANHNKLLEAIKRIKPNGIMVLSLDNDEAGRDATKNIMTELNKYKWVKTTSSSVAAGYKDPNECLVRNKEKFIHILKSVVSEIKASCSLIPSLGNANSLYYKNVPATKWIIKDLLPVGITVFSAAPKIGKSWMGMQMCSAISEGKDFLSKPTKKGQVVYFALEDDESLFKERLNIQNSNKEPSKDFFYKLEGLKNINNGLLEQLEYILQINPNIQAMVIDTFHFIRSPGDKNQLAYNQDYNDLKKLKHFATNKGIAIMVVHHNRKMKDEDDIFNQISGSVAMLGAADMCWLLAKKKRNDELTHFETITRKCKHLKMTIRLKQPEQIWVVEEEKGDDTLSRWRREYEESQVVKVVTAKLRENPLGYRAKASQILLDAVDILGSPIMMNETQVGKEISRFATRFKEHKITHKTERGRIHFFSYTHYVPKDY